MSKALIKRLFLFAPVLFLSFSIISCSTTKKIKYFEDIPDSGQLKIVPTSAYMEPKIQVDDILTIIISTVDPAATQNINLGNVAVSGLLTSSMASANSQSVVSGYLVNKSGNVEMPILGEVHLLGLTTDEASKVIKEKASQFYKDASVIVRYANFKITVTGEVTKPSIYVMPNEKVTILDALSVAGDLTIYGKRDNILLLRENSDASKTPYRIDLTKSNIMSQPYYYLRQNDYIYVEPSQGKAAANDIQQTRSIAILSSIVTVVIVLISRINF
ncbi:MAG: Polysaccharide export outer membrane protein [Mucilaginibacter sp.]|nr:Polysaccharide export outer membrane protein [Mucilaginibacter sp.]